MANEQKIDEIIDQKAFDQMTKLQSELAGLKDKLVEAILYANELNKVIGDAKGFRAFQKAATDAALAQEKVNKAAAQASIYTQKAQQETIKLAQLKDKVAAQEAAAAAKQEAAAKKAMDADNARIEAMNAKTKTIISDSQAEVDAYNNASRGVDGMTTALNAENIASAEAANAASRLTASTNEETKSTNAANEARKKLAATKKQAAILAAQEKLNAEQVATAFKNQIKELNAAKGSIDQRSAALARLQKTYSGLSAEERNSPFGQRLAKVIPQLNDQVLTLEKSLGKSQRNVGNYLSTAYGGLKTLANILPGVGIAGVLAFATEPIMNYIIALDLFKKKLDQLALTRKEVNSVNLKGAQDAQQEITHLKVLYDTAKNVELSTKQRYDAAKSLQELYPETFKNYTIEQIELGKVDGAYQRLTVSIIATARARASEQKITENSSRILDDEQKMIDLQSERVKKVKELNAAIAIDKSTQGLQSGGTAGGTGNVATATTAARREAELRDIDKQINNLARDREILNTRNLALTKNIVDQQKKGADVTDPKNTKEKKLKVDTSVIDEQKATVERERTTQKAIIDDEKASYAERFNALNNYYQLGNNLAELDYTKKVKKGENEKQVFAEQQSDIEKNIVEFNKIRNKLTDDANKYWLDSFTETEKKEIQTLRDSNADKLDEIEQYRSAAAQGVAEQYAKGIISRKEYEQQLLDIDAQAAQDSLQVQIDALKKIIETEKNYLGVGIGTNKQLGDDEKKLAQLEIGLSKLKTDAQIKDKEKVAEASKRLRDAEIEIGRELLTFGIAVGDGIFTNRINKIQEEIDANETKKAYDIDQVNNSVATEQEKADKIAVINAKADSQKQILEQRQRKEKEKQAKFDRAANIANIIANTAVAVMKTYAEFGFPFGVPLAIAQAAIGAIQVATVLATPIPKYKYGKSINDNYSGPAMVGDGYERELVIEPDGKMSWTPDKPTLTHVSSGTQIIGGDDLRRLRGKPDPFTSTSTVQRFDFSAVSTTIEKSNDKVIKAIKSQSSGTYITKRGWAATQEKMNAMANYLKNNL